MKFTVRYVDLRKKEYVDLLMYLQRECLPGDVPMKIDRGHWWIAYAEDGKPVGFAGMVRSAQWIDTGYMCRAGVLEEYQGHGLQKKLIRVRIQKARKLNWAWLITDTTNNPASANSLISLGFRMYTPSIPWAWKHSSYWRLNIAGEKARAVQRPKKAVRSVKSTLREEQGGI
jgi:GNAT superfamily N-acetyltransferase